MLESRVIALYKTINNNEKYSGRIACVCGNDNINYMNEWSVACECVCMRLNDRMVSGMTVAVLHGFCAVILK